MINLMAPINTLGYGVVGTNIARSLNDFGYSLFPIGNLEWQSELDGAAIKSGISRAAMHNKSHPSVKIYHQFDLSVFPMGSRYIGFPIFELDDFSEREKWHLKNVDKLFVCSEWAKSVIESSVNNHPEIFVVPLGVDGNIFFPESYNSWNINSFKNEKTIFFNCGKWEKRKGHDILCEAFKAAFEDSDEVELWMMNSNPFLSSDQTLEWHNKYKMTNVKILDRARTQFDLANIMRAVDCGVFPSRAEGWNLEALELMSCGKSVIITDYSAHKEFCNSNNSLLIEIDELESANDGIWFHGQGRWAKFGKNQFDNLVNHLRMFHSRRKEVGVVINTAGLETACEYTWKNSARKVLEYA